MDNKELEKISKLIENIKNDINIEFIPHFLNWFYQKLDLHFNKNTPDLKINKGSIFYVNLWQNIWWELNKTRPCLVYSHKKANFWNTVIVIPLKSYKWNKINNFQVLITATDENCLNKDSIVDISSMRQISKKRLLDKIWDIEKIHFKEIDKKLVYIFWIKNNE
ncbi:MAG: hypothetical protein ACD_78C00197G0016 [uncultured bacterium (gcode 4)]|uniref:Uncharacterized protein n=1 Tax=uncultured bacterium (gcode 4) TaxID=1234023 RepID=K1XYB8_9BACT|nr:MAG: hypothetical protein ACD_78C00197G0016 [uncultured bacterium (gcode 4)]